MLISSETLMEIHREGNTRILDCRYLLNDPGFGIASYRRAHIPGSIYLDLADDLSGPITARTGRHPLPAVDHFVETVGKWGVADDSIVIAYDNGQERWQLDAGGCYVGSVINPFMSLTVV